MALFDFFKKKSQGKIINIYSPIDGRVIPLSEIPDEAYAQKMVGDGCGIEPIGDTICCPVDGEVEIFGTNHVVNIETEEGLVKLLEDGYYKAGTEFIKINMEVIKDYFLSFKSPFVTSNMDDIATLEVVGTGEVKAGDLLMKVILK